MKKLFIAFGAAAMLLGAASCNKSSQAGADSFADSLAIYFGRSQGALCAERITSLPENDREKFSKDAFLRGFKQIVMADTADIAYFYGVSVGMSVSQQLMGMNRDGLDIDAQTLYQNFAAAFKADSIDENVANIDNGVFQTLMMKAQQQAQQKRMAAQAQEEEARRGEAADNEAKGAAFVEEAKKADSSIKTTESGLSYKVVKEGTGAKAGDNDKIKVHYTGKLIDGTVFDSSVERGEPVDFTVSQVVPGFGEGLKLMNKGAKYVLYIPASLAYGNNSVGTIPPGSTLVFDVEVLDIQK